MKSFRSRLSFLSFVLLMGVFSKQINAATIETKAESVKLINIKIDNSTFAEELESVQTNGVTYLKWSQAEHINQGDVGKPDIPTLQRLIVVDPTKVYETILTIDSTSLLGDVNLYPVQPDAPEGSPSPKFAIDRKAYTLNKNFGAPWVEIGKTQRMGRFAVMPIKIHLAQYNPRKKELRYINDLKITISAKDALATADAQFVTASQLTALEQLTLNGDSVIADLSIPRKNGAYLVLTTDDLLPAARNFAERHREQGVTVYYETIKPATGPSAIKNLIQNYYKTQNLEAVLLFGDETKVPLYSWSGTPGDSFYSMVDGDDGLADILIGRIPASNIAEADVFVQKTSVYEAGLSSGTSKSKNIMLVAHRESYPGKYTANLESVRTDPNLKNLEFSIQYGGRGAKNQSVIDLTEQNFSVINYRGHGSSQSWSGWGADGSSFGTTQINSVKNADTKMAVFFNIACSNGAVQSSSKSMAERLLWPQGDNPNRGAIAVLAATEPSLTAVNHKYNRHLFTHLQATASASVGLVNMLAANQLVRDAGGSVPSNNKMYILFGDPLLAFKHD